MILQILLEQEYPHWAKHPAVNLWKDHERALANYGVAMCSEWIRRGYIDNQLEYFHKIVFSLVGEEIEVRFSDVLYSSHRAALKAKNPNHYRQFHWKEVPKIDYVWY